MKTKVFFLIILNALVFTLSGQNYFFDDSYSYQVTDAINHTVKISGCMASATGEIAIPETLQYNGATYTITSIGSSVFSFDKITGITLPNTVTSIGNYAFSNCSELTTVTLGNAVSSIGMGAFSECTNLTTISDLPAITELENQVFYNCKKLSAVSFANGLLTIGESAFYNCLLLANIQLGETLLSIGNNAFKNCRGFINFEMPNTVTSIGDGVFYECTGLTGITVSESLKNIGEYAFYNCSNLESITLPDSVTVINQYLFYGCTSLISVVLGNSVGLIRNSSFGNCTSLTDFTISTITPPSFESWFFDPFNGVNVEEVTLHVPNEALMDYESSDVWANFNYPGGIAQGKSFEVDGIIYTVIDAANNYVALSGYSNLGDGNIVIPDFVVHNDINYSLTTLNKGVFFSIGGVLLRSIVLPNSVTSIGDSAFYYCRSLSSITLSNNIVTIGNSAFAYCDSLKEITIPDGVSAIEDYTFFGCTGLEKVTMGNSVLSIGTKAFYRCRGLSEIYLNTATPPLVGEYAFYSDQFSNDNSGGLGIMYKIAPLISLHVPEFSIDDYKNVEVWEDFRYPETSSGGNPNCIGGIIYKVIDEANHYVEVSGYETITGSVNIPETVTIEGNTYTVTAIGEEAFYGCEDLTAIGLPETVTVIANNAFMMCSNLNSITLSDAVITIGNYAFANCSSLTSVIMGNAVTDIGAYAFFQCVSLNSFTITAPVPPAVGDRAFVYVIFSNGTSFVRELYPNITLHLPESYVSVYQNTSPWCYFNIEVYSGINVFTDDIKVFPNPVTNFLTVDVPAGVVVEGISIYSTAGQKVISTLNAEVNASNLPDGMYYLIITTTKGQSVKKILKCKLY